MSPIAVGVILIFGLLFVLAFGWPVALSLGVFGFAGLWYLLGWVPAIMKVALAPFESMSYDFAVLPLFILMAEVIFVTGIAGNLFDLASKWLGHLPGGIAIATIAAATIFSAMSGSAVAGVVTFALVALPSMRKYDYDMTLATGSICAGGPLSALIPPSGFLIFYGILTETSISKLFIAAIIPGVLIAIMYCLTIFIRCRLNPSIGPIGPKFNWVQKFTAFKNSADALVLILISVGGIMIGLFTPTEGGAIGAFGAIIIGLLRRQLNRENFKKALYESVKNAGMIYSILICVTLFKYAMAVTKIPFWLSDTISHLGFPPIIIMILIILMYIILGTAMEELSMMMVTIPILFPVVQELGFDLIWFGIIVLRMMMIAGISPPIGMTMVVIQGAAKVPIQTVWKGVIPFLFADIIHTALLIAFPSIALFLPRLMAG